MRLYFVLGCLVLGVWGEEKELIMLEIEPLVDDKAVSKRSPQGEAHYGGQYSQQEIPPEYLSLLQELQAQQGVTSQQVHPNDIQQLLVTRTPQQFSASLSHQAAPRQRLSPQAQEQRRLQQVISQKNLREQEARDSQRQQLREFYHQQGLAIPAAATAAYQLQPQIQPHLQEQQQQQQQQGALQYYQSQLVGQVSPQQVQEYYSQPDPEQVSYAQVQFGAARQAVASDHKPKAQSQLLYAPQPQQVVYQIPRGQPTTEAPKTTTLPQQYLIETTKPEPPRPEDVVSIPRPRPPLVYYRPQADYRDIQSSLLAQQEQAQYAQQQQEAVHLPQGVPSRSAIYVSKSATPVPNQSFLQSHLPQVRIPTPQGQRPLTETELKALIDAGFHVSPQPGDSQEYVSPYAVTPQRSYYRALAGKRQSKRVPKPVPLSQEEREALAQQGIRNLYRVETSESQNTPVTYVLALGKPQNS